MLTGKVQDAINDQISREFYSAFLYLSMSGYFEANDLPGFASWMRSQYQEELAHAGRLFDFVVDTGGRPRIAAVDQPPHDFDSPLAVMEEALSHEREITQAIHRLYELSTQEKCYSAEVEMQWFIKEQLEEEKTVSDIVAQLRMAGDNGAALFLLDKELGARQPGQGGGNG